MSDPAMGARFRRNSKQSFLIGASWVHEKEWRYRLIHIYLGPWLFTYAKDTLAARQEAPNE